MLHSGPSAYPARRTYFPALSVRRERGSSQRESLRNQATFITQDHHPGKILKMAARYNVMFLCTGNSARSIMAEAIMNRKGSPTFTAYSAGSHPAGLVRPESIKQLQSAGLSTEGLRSKSWDEFSKPAAPALHFVFTVCDNAANEVCPVWPGHPLTAHWGIPDPAAVEGTPEEINRAFSQAFAALDRRISLFLALPIDTLDTLALQKEIDAIGHQ